MASYYVDLDDLTTGNAGTTIDPWSLEDYVTSKSGFLEGDEIYLRGAISGIDSDAVNPPEEEAIIFDKWGDDPWRIQWELSSGAINFADLALNNGIIYVADDEAYNLMSAGDCINMIIS